MKITKYQIGIILLSLLILNYLLLIPIFGVDYQRRLQRVSLFCLIGMVLIFQLPFILFGKEKIQKLLMCIPIGVISTLISLFLFEFVMVHQRVYIGSEITIHEWGGQSTTYFYDGFKSLFGIKITDLHYPHFINQFIWVIFSRIY